ncbi:DUF4442 domain-containing protein [Desulfosediminicola flagellatus]|uniref:DUF4442 domain-containing protein n=1 Tax=Desulfosediminicola flagellatus TaxID=2569541 RepID=UPI0010AC6B30|nr:DUF4442 domain-containing protein [Desulfosediminicola flagellatus]
MYLSPAWFKFLLNIYPPYLGAGIKVEQIHEDWYGIRVSMKLRWYNRNAVHVHFGGSLYSMVDPHLMLMHMQLLGKDFIVWDKAASISFIRPGKGKVTADFMLTKKDIEKVIEKTCNGKVFEPTYDIEIKNEKGKVVARVTKELYIKRK